MKSTTRASVLATITLASFPFAALAQSNAGDIACGVPYVVVSGDTLSQISNRAYGTAAFGIIYDANRSTIGNNPNLIQIGQRFDIPCQGGDTVVAQEAPAAAPATETEETVVAVTRDGPVILTFNKASNPKFVINSGIIDIYLDQITEVTDGRVQFIDPEEVNQDPKVQLDLVTSGQVDGAYVFNGYLEASHPVLQLPMTPLMGGSAEQTAVSLWNLHENYLAETDYFAEAKLMGFVAAPAAHIWRLDGEPAMSEENIAEANNYAIPYFAGLDTRGPAIVREETEKQLMAQNEAQNGTLTFFMAHGAARAVGVWTPERTVTEVDYGMYTPTFSVVLSNEAWSRISPADQAAISEVSGEYLAHRSASWDVFDNGHRSHMIETGLRAVKAGDDLMGELQTYSDMRNAEWKNVVSAMGVDADAALMSYKADLDALQDRLLFR
ncbi:MAG: LysM peptidoglycan-binding domain-containing protein [Pseudomonadota bacterium]